MKIHVFLSAALLGFLNAFSGRAQTPAASKAGTSLPSTVPPGMVPANATTPTGTSGQLYPANGVPTRNIDGGTQRADQPVGGNAAVTGSQPTKRLHKGRASATRP